MFNKRGMDLSINTIIIIILALLVLVIAILMLTGVSGGFLDTIRNQLGFGKSLVNESMINIGK